MRNTTEIIIRSGGIIIYYHDRSVVRTLGNVLHRLTEYQMKKDWQTQEYIKELKAIFYIHDEDVGELRFHGTCRQDVMAAIQTHPEFERFTIKQFSPVPPKPITLNYISPKLPRKRQPEYIEFMTNIGEHIRVLPATPGSGKTLCTIYGITKTLTKTAVILQPSLKDNWVDNFKELTDIKDDEIVWVGGDKDWLDLEAYMNQVIEGTDNYKVVIFSTNTLQRFITGYKEKLYPLTPEELFDKSGFGLKVVDEAHKWLHFHCLLDTYSNVRNHHFLTGTIMNESPFLGRMENTLYPMTDRCEVDPPTNHLKLVAYGYRFNGQPPKHMGPMGYSHIKFEGEITKKKRLLAAYHKMLGSILYTHFVKEYQPGQRALVFFSTVKMVDSFAKLLGTKLPNLKTVTYLAGHDESRFEDADIIVSTTKKAGTGVDIKNLTFLLHTVMISSKGENHQNANRLRMRHDGNTTFSYIYCTQMPKNRDYHTKRLRDLKTMVNSVDVRVLNSPLG